MLRGFLKSLFQKAERELGFMNRTKTLPLLGRKNAERTVQIHLAGHFVLVIIISPDEAIILSLRQYNCFDHRGLALPARQLYQYLN